MIQQSKQVTKLVKKNNKRSLKLKKYHWINIYNTSNYV